MYKQVVGFLLIGLSLCLAKRSHHHKKHNIIKNVTVANPAKEKSTISKKLKTDKDSMTNATGKSVIFKKQNLGMPLNNNDDQGLGGEPVGHLDASEGVGGLGGDQEGIPIGMGAGAEPLGMAKGKPMVGPNVGNPMQGLGDESLHDAEVNARPFHDQQGGDYIEGEHGENSMNGHPSNFMPNPNNGDSMNMMGHPGGMNNFMSNGEEENDHGGNFMDHEGDGNNFRGPKKDPLGAEIRPFNDEFKNMNEGGEQGNHMMGNPHGGSPHGVSFMSPMHNESDDHDYSNPSNGDEIVNGNMASIHGGDNEMGKPGHGDFNGGNFMGQSPDEESFRGPKKDPLGADIKPFNDEHRGDDMGEEEEQVVDHPMKFMGHKDKSGFAKQKENNEHTGSQGGESDLSNPSPSDIGKALNGNLAALDSVNIQGDSDVAEMVRKATHQKEFHNNNNKDTGTFNGMSLLEPGYSSTNKQFMGPGPAGSPYRRTKKGTHSKRAHAKSKVARGKTSKIKKTRK